MTALLALGLCLAADPSADRPTVVVVVGAAGLPEYGTLFRTWADKWKAAAEKGAANVAAVGLDPETGEADRDRLKNLLAKTAATPGSEPLWLVMVGHGTFDGKDARFNLRGPDITPAELAGWLRAVKRPVAVVNCASASGPFVNALSGPDRVVVTATKSGQEVNFARFGGYLADAVGDPAADLDKDGQVSLLEAFLVAGGKVAEFYRDEGRLATEHPLLDDNGDQLGTPADRFRGTRSTDRSKAGADGTRAGQLCLVPSDRERTIPTQVRQRRDELERSLAALRDQKDKLAEDDYFARIEPILIELARLGEQTGIPTP